MGNILSICDHGGKYLVFKGGDSVSSYYKYEALGVKA